MEEKVLYLGTVVYPLREGRILLGYKTEKIGANCWNGYGGGYEDTDNDLEECAVRELEEESGIVGETDSLTKIAIVDFHNTKTDGSQFVSEIHFYTLTQFINTPLSTQTMINPTWFDTNNLPWREMMPGDKDWLPLALSGEKLYAKVYYGPYQKELIKPTEIFSIEEYNKLKAAN